MGDSFCGFYYEDIYYQYLKKIMCILLKPQNGGNPGVVQLSDTIESIRSKITSSYNNSHLSQETLNSLSDCMYGNLTDQLDTTPSPFEILSENNEFIYAMYDNDLNSSTAPSGYQYKCLLIWNVVKYYNTVRLSDQIIKKQLGFQEEGIEDPYPIDQVGCFIVIEFGDVILNGIEYLQTITISFDSNPELDKFGTNQTKIINWFANQHAKLIRKEGMLTIQNIENGGQIELYPRIANISKNIYNDKFAKLVRRTVSIKVRYCNCSVV